MKGYSAEIKENCAGARLEGVDASYKDLCQVCGRIRSKDAVWAMDFLDKASRAEIPVLYKRHNKKLGHRRELGGKKGRYPKKAAGIVLKVLKSALANAMVKGFGEEYDVTTATANKKHAYPRLQPKGRRGRSYYVLSRVEIIVRGRQEVPSGVEVSAPAAVEKKEEKPVEKKEASPAKKIEEKPIERREEKPAVKDAAKPKTEMPHIEHKHEAEKEAEAEHAKHERNAFEHNKGKREVVKREG